MEAFTRFTNQTQGQERLFRVAQYTCMLLRYLLEPKADKEKVVMKLKELESGVSTGRKSNLNRVVYFICDTVLWVRSVGLASGINKEKWRMWAACHYYYFLLLNLVRDLYELSLQMEQVARDKANREQSPSQDPLGCSVADEETEWLQSCLLLLFRSLRKHPPLLLDTVKNLCDILNPLAQLGICKSNAGIIGLGGLVSSLVGIVTVAWPHMKLKTH
ncbi:peroxisomal membrane protein 11A-like isoform X1 [Saccopteryx leptura]|uniref:peroxisomal membrane protein 11A-like isoform X1 n=1 Tax=Saccopteryx leptura TaxID=249018 RepID=UPI00339C253C